MPGLSCRFYQPRLPQEEDVVMVKVRSNDEMGAYVHLLEYNNAEGMIPLSELSRRRIRSINKLIRIGREEVVQVIRVDNEKGYIDLSKRRVNEEERAKCQDRFTKSKSVYSILHQVAIGLEYTKDEELESLYRRTAWVFDERSNKRGYGAYEAFKQAESDPSILDGLDLTEAERKGLIENMKRRKVAQTVKIRADIEVQCYEYEGVDTIKDALRAGLAYSTDAMRINIQLIAHPRFMMTATTLDPTEGLSVLKQAMAAIKDRMEENKGIFEVKLEPKVMTETDEKELARELDGQKVNPDEEVVEELKSVEKAKAEKEATRQLLESLLEENVRQEEAAQQQLEGVKEEKAEKEVVQQLEGLEENAGKEAAQQLESPERGPASGSSGAASGS